VMVSLDRFHQHVMVVQQPWLRLHHAEAVHPYALAVFTSL
jgi:hypothetical protein